MWDTLKSIYGREKNVLWAKSKSLRGKFEDMWMIEGETIVQYCGRIKEVVNAIRGSEGKIDEETMIRKVLRTFLPIYSIRVSTIQEMRCTPSSDITLEGFFGRLTAFEISNFYNFTLGSIELSKLNRH